MDLYTLYSNLSSWLGWPITFLVILGVSAWGYFVLNNRISLLKEQNNYLEMKLRDAESFRPDIVAIKLAERHKQQADVIEILNQDNIRNMEEIKKREEELEQTRAEMQVLATQLDEAISSLYGEYPRGGKIQPVIQKDFIKNLENGFPLIVPIDRGKEVNFRDENITGPLRLVMDAGMGQRYLYLETSNGKGIGEVFNPYDDDNIYKLDYLETLLSLLVNEEAREALVYLLPDTAKVISAQSFANYPNIGWNLIIPITLDAARKNLEKYRPSLV
jgi:hypothetical protein